MNYFYESLKKLYESINLPKFLYHATYKPFLKSILSKGLGNTWRKMWSDSKGLGVVYLATDPNEAISYAENAEWLDDVDDYDKYAENIIVLKIDTDKLDTTKFFKDENIIEGNTTFEYHGIINKDAIVKIMTQREAEIANEEYNMYNYTDSLIEDYSKDHVISEALLLEYDEEKVNKYIAEYSKYAEEANCILLFRGKNGNNYSDSDEAYAGIFFAEKLTNAAEYGDVSAYGLDKNSRIFNWESDCIDFIYTKHPEMLDYSDDIIKKLMRESGAMYPWQEDENAEYTCVNDALEDFGDYLYPLWPCEYLAYLVLKDQYDGARWGEVVFGNQYETEYQVWNTSKVHEFTGEILDLD